MSGWLIKSIIIEINNRKLNAYKVFDVLYSSFDKIFAVKSTKKGLINSIGWRLKKYKLNHLFDPLTSTPIIGTRIKEIKNNMKIGTIRFFRKLNSMNEIKNIKVSAIDTNNSCFEKKK